MSRSAAVDVRAADDRLRTVVEAHPGLPLAVVVGRPDEKRRVTPSNPHALASLLLPAAPDPYERILPPLAPDRRLVGMAGQDACRVGQLEENVHHRAPHGSHVTAADGVAEQRVAR